MGLEPRLRRIFRRGDGCAAQPGRILHQDVGLQLYTVRDAMGRDLDGTLPPVAAAGYRLVETAGTYGRPAAELRALFDKHGIRTTAGHYALADAESNPDEVFATAKTLGQEFVVHSAGSNRRSARRRRRGSLPACSTSSASRRSAAGLKIAYHNHEFEFENVRRLDDGDGALLANTDPGARVVRARRLLGVQGRATLRGAVVARYPGRFTMLHLKDSTAAPGKEFADVGKGVIDFPRLISAAQRNGLRYAFVERDVAPDPLASIRASHAYLATVLAG